MYRKSRVEIKQEAKALIRANLIPILVTTAIVVVTATLLTRLVNLVTYGTMTPELTEAMSLLENGQTPDGDIFAATAALTARSGSAAFFFSVLAELFLTVLWGGYYLFCMGSKQGLQMPYSTLFDGLAVAGKLIWCGILTGIYVFLWSLLFLIPGFIAAYRYRFAVFNILTDSSLSANQAISLSCRQTKGRKMDLFVLDLSFLGWQFLSALTFGILDIWLIPYMTLSLLSYFEQAQLELGRVPYGEQSAAALDD